MLYVWIGFLNPKALPIPETVQQQTNDFLGQPLIKIRSAGPLRASSGDKAAMMIVFEEESRAAADEFVRSSPYLQADLYERDDLYEYENEVG